MDIRDYLSDDGQALLALCSALALPRESGTSDAAPLTPSEWQRLARQLQDSPWQQPAALQGRSASELAQTLTLPTDEAERICGLLARSGRLALELESLFARGMWAVTRVDEQYPKRLQQTLKHQAPPVLFGAGEVSLLSRGGVAVIGSRNIDPVGAAFAREVGRRSAAARVPVVSGGARGSDRLAMEGALEAGGVALGVLADSLERTVRQPDLRQLLLDGQLVLLTPYAPAAGFSVGAAMGRNKVIYGMADYAVVVSCDYQTGGTWAGATEALKGGWCPVFVREGPEVPQGNRELLKKGATPLPEAEFAQLEDLPTWLQQHAQPTATQRDLFG